MKTVRTLFSTLVGLVVAPLLMAQVPGVIRYQGVLESNGNNFNGTGQFKFALVNDGNPGLVTFWSNDGTLNNTEPSNYVSVDVDHGVFTVALGDSSIANMVAIPTTVFTNSHVHLRIWFSSGNGNAQFTQLLPDQPITSVGYAMMSANVADGAITTDKIANGAVTGAKIAPNTITSSDIADVLTLQTLNLGGISWDGSLNLFAKPGGGGGGIINPSGDRRGLLAGDSFGSELDLLLSNGSTGAVLSARAPGGLLRLWDGLGGLTTVLGSANGGGDLNLFQIDSKPGIKLNGDKAAYNQPSAGGEISVHSIGGGIGLLLDGNHSNAGRIEVRQPSSPIPFVDIFGRGVGDGGEVWLSDAGGRTRIKLQGTDAMVRLLGPNLNPTMELRGNDGDLVALTRVGVAATINAPVLQASLGLDSNGGLVRTRDENDNTTTLIGAGLQGGYMKLYQGSTEEGVTLDGDNGNGGAIAVNHANGMETIHLIGGQDSNSGARFEMMQANGALTVILDGEVGNGGGGYLQLRKGNGTATITLDSDVSGEGTITTQVLQITGGSDLSEKFEINPTGNPLEAGMVVCIDPQNPTKLVVSSRAYDQTVAGVVSGAGGVKPGMLMSQAGSKADGQHPVALTGRVYCHVDASYGAIRPGDLITTSDTVGHGMKVTDHSRANGAVLGKAMTGLESGRGLVLLLVSLQ